MPGLQELPDYAYGLVSVKRIGIADQGMRHVNFGAHFKNRTRHLILHRISDALENVENSGDGGDGLFRLGRESTINIIARTGRRMQWLGCDFIAGNEDFEALPAQSADDCFFKT